MSSLLLAILFGLACAAAGLGVATALDRSRPPLALGSGIALAILVVFAGNVAAIDAYRPGPLAAGWVMLIATGISHVSRLRQDWHGGLASTRTRIVLLAGAAALAPLLVLPVPFDTDAQGFGMLALAVRDGGTLDTLAPGQAGVAYVYSPGALLLFAFWAWLTGAAMPDVMLALGHAVLVLIVWIAWDLGDAIADVTSASAPVPTRRGQAWPWSVSVAALLSVGLWTALADAHYTAVFGLLFALTYLTAFLRWVVRGGWRDLAAGCCALAAVAMTHPDSAIILAWGVLSLLLAGAVWWPPSGSPLRRRWLVGTPIACLGALLAALPWLIALRPLLDSGVRSPFTTSPSHWRQLLLYQGLVWPLLAAVGGWIWCRRRQPWAAAMVIWALLLADAATTGWIERALPFPFSFLTKFSYPFSVAWHGPIVPYLVLGAGVFVWAFERAGRTPVRAPRWGVTAILLIGIGLTVLFADPLRRLAGNRLQVQGAFASRNDLAAMAWIREHAPPHARVLNYPGDYERGRDWEAHWAPVVTERACVYFRMQPFFLERPSARHDEPWTSGADVGPQTLAAVYEEQRRMLAFWRDPRDPRHADLLAHARIAYVLVPESIGDPASRAHAWRWAPPARLPGVRSTPADAPYLRLAYEAGGAQVFEVVPDAGPPDS